MFGKVSTWILYSLAALSVAVAVTLFFWPHASEEAEENEISEEEFVLLNPEQMEEEGIALEVAQPGTIQTSLKAPARLLLNQERLMHLVPKVSGVVTEANKWMGDTVTLGELLAVLESADLAEAKSRYLDAVKKEALTSSHLAREKQLYDKRISAAQDYQNALLEQESAHIELELARQHLQTIGLKPKEIERLPEANAGLLSRYEIRAPMKGMIMDKALTKGERIETTQEIYHLADPTSLWAEVFLFPTDFSHLEDKMELELIHPNGEKRTAKILSISPSVESRTGAVRLIALLDNQNQDWLHGIYVQANLKGQAKQVALVIPQEALQQIDGESVLFVKREKGFEIRPVKVGLCDQKCAEVIMGLSPGESYASKNTFLLKAEHSKSEAEHD